MDTNFDAMLAELDEMIAWLTEGQEPTATLPASLVATLTFIPFPAPFFA